MQDEDIQEGEEVTEDTKKGERGERGGIRIERESATVHTCWKERAVARCMLNNWASAMKHRGLHEREEAER